VEVARGLGARVVSHERKGFVEPARAFACAQSLGEWILILDADELVPAALARTLRRLAAEDAADVVRIPRLNYLLGEPLLHSGWNPGRDRQVRFFKRGRVVLSGMVHEGPRPEAQARILDLPVAPGLALVHFNYVDTAQFLQKLDAYTSIEARQAYEAGERPSTLLALWRASREFATRYAWHGGWRDGWRGLHLCLLMAGYAIARSAKLHERVLVGRREEVEQRYRHAAERLLAEVGKGNEESQPRPGSGG
jgi:hypothetical protein